MLIADPLVSPELAGGLNRLDALHDRLADETGAHRRYDGPIRRLALAEAVEASTAIEGYRMPISQAASLLEGRPLDPASDAQQAVAAYGRAMDHVLVLADDPHFAWDLRLLLDLHFDCCWWQWSRGPGRLRTDPIRVTGAAGATRYAAPPAGMVLSLMGELVDYLARATGHRVVRAAMAHLHLASIHGFRDGNGRHARIVHSLVLAREGLVSAEYCSIEPYLAAHTSGYYAALEEAQGGAYDRWRVADGWVAFCVRAHVEQAERRLALLKAAGRRWTALEDLARQRGWSDRLVIGLELAVVTGALTRTAYAREADVSPATASSDLRRLLDAGLVEQQGRGRSTRYGPSEALRRIVTDRDA